MKPSRTHGNPITPNKGEPTSVPIIRTLGTLLRNLTTLLTMTNLRIPIRNPILSLSLKTPTFPISWARTENSKELNGNVVSKRGYASIVENQDTSPPTAIRQLRPGLAPPSSSRRSPQFQQTNP